jgi:hypothetical protein
MFVYDGKQYKTSIIKYIWMRKELLQYVSDSVFDIKLILLFYSWPKRRPLISNVSSKHTKLNIKT